MAAESHDLNPYATPATVSDTPLADGAPVRTLGVRRLVALQAIVIVVSLVAEAYEHETIIGSGAIFSMVGLAIVVTAFRKRDQAAVMFGGSAIVFASFIVFLINVNAWTPAQGNYPITILSLTYAAFALPASVWLALMRRQSEDSDRLHSSVDRDGLGND